MWYFSNFWFNLLLNDLGDFSEDESLRYEILPIKTRYIKPNEPYDIIIENSKDIIKDGDFLVISETPIAISQGRLVDEGKFKPSITAFILADIWSKYIWGYILGPLLGVKKRTIKNLRNLPQEARSHKEVVLRCYGLKHALKPASEAGIDLSNAPGTYVSLLPKNPQKVAEDIAGELSQITNRNVVVIIIDTDATYELAGIKFTSIPQAVAGIRSNMGIFGYVLGRLGKLLGPTPLAISVLQNVDRTMEIAKMADKYQRKNKSNIETVYDMKKAFNGEIGDITVEMLDSVEHTPAVIVRRK